MSIVQTEYPDMSAAPPREPQSILLIIDGASEKDLRELHDAIMVAVDSSKQEHHEVHSGIVPTKYLKAVRIQYLR